MELDLEVLSRAIGHNLEECVTALHIAVSKAAQLPTDDSGAPDLSKPVGRIAYETRLVKDWFGASTWYIGL